MGEGVGKNSRFTSYDNRGGETIMISTTDTEFGKQLRELREKKGMTRRELADKAGVVYQTIYLLETGQTKYPTVRIAVKLAKALDSRLTRLSISE